MGGEGEAGKALVWLLQIMGRDQAAAETTADHSQNGGIAGSFKEHIGDKAGLGKQLIDQLPDGGFLIHQDKGLVLQLSEIKLREMQASGVFFAAGSRAAFTDGMAVRNHKKDFLRGQKNVFVISAMLVTESLKA